MSEDVATLADALVDPSGQPETPTAASTEAAQPEKVATSQPPSEFTYNKDAEALGQILLDQGYTPDKINDLLNAPRVMEQMRYQLENDPITFLRELERANPKVGEKAMEVWVGEYVRRYGDKDKPQSKSGAEDGEVAILRQRLEQIERERGQERENARLASVRSRLTGRVDDLFNMEEVKKLGLSRMEQKLMRHSLDVELGKDSQATQRILNGNFVDVPRTFKGLLDEYAADKKAVATAAEEARKAQARQMSFEFDSGPGGFGLPKEALNAFEKEIDSIWSGK